MIKKDDSRDMIFLAQFQAAFGGFATPCDLKKKGKGEVEGVHPKS
jgi:hypothetical protein